MKLSKSDLDHAVEAGILSSDQSRKLWDWLGHKYLDKPRFELVHIVYYFGALLGVSAMGWFVNRAWERFGGGGLFLISMVLAGFFILAGRYCWFKQNLKIPGGLLYTMAVAMTPLAVYGLQRMTGFWLQGDPGVFRDFHVWIRGSWFLMEVATIVTSLVALYFIRFPFLTSPLAFSLWYMSMDLVPLLTGTQYFSWHERSLVSMWFGVGMLVVTYLIDRRTREDFSFWGYLFGLMAFWGGLTSLHSDSELAKFFYCLINIGLVFLSVFLSRKAFIVFGAIGVFTYIGHLAYDVFEDSLLFPLALTLLGVAIIFVGVLYQRNRERVENAVISSLPSWLRKLRPIERA